MDRRAFLKQTFSRTVLFLNYLLLIPRLSAYWSLRLGFYGIAPERVRYDKETRRLFLKELGVFLSRQKHVFFLKEFENFVTPLARLCKARFSVTDEDELMIEVEGLRLLIRTWEELFILSEIFLKRVYDFRCPQKVVVLDIGMNVGFASLHFASKENVHLVVGYEPCRSTYEQALEHFRLNPVVSAKIEPCNVGVGASNARVSLDYSHDWKGTASTSDLSAIQGDRGPNVVREEVGIRSIVEIMDWIQERCPGLEIVAKIDCEGSEYAILKRLCEENRLSSIRALIMEWHQGGSDPLISDLVHHGFVVFPSHPSHSSHRTGMLYAVRIGNPDGPHGLREPFP